MSEEQIFRAGELELRVDIRTFGDDGGPAVRVYGQVGEESVQLLRFDCFRKNPHYHFDPSGKDDLRPLDQSKISDPVGWTIEQLRHNMTEMISTAGYNTVASKVDQAAVAEVLPDVEFAMRG